MQRIRFREGMLSMHHTTHTNTVVALAQAEIEVELELQVRARLTENSKLPILRSKLC